jgi:hypothetical protein
MFESWDWSHSQARPISELSQHSWLWLQTSFSRMFSSEILELRKFWSKNMQKTLFGESRIQSLIPEVPGFKIFIFSHKYWEQVVNIFFAKFQLSVIQANKVTNDVKFAMAVSLFLRGFLIFCKIFKQNFPENRISLKFFKKQNLPFKNTYFGASKKFQPFSVESVF